jgi:uncharacterized protein (DUF1501 family)
MTTTPTDGCAACAEGSRFLSMSRRGFLTLAGAAGLVTATTIGGARVGFLDPAARAAGGAATDVLVVLSLRGGIDGLSVVVPAAAPELPGLRPTIQIPTSQLKQVDQTFGLHPALSPLFGLWDNGSLAAVQAVGMGRPNRSHFDAMDEMERADPRSALRTGWIDRTIGVIGDDSTFGVTVMGTTTLPTSTDGPNPQFAVRSVNGVVLSVDERDAPLDAWRQAVEELHAGGSPDLRDPTLRGFEAVSAVRRLPAAGEGYPNGGLASALRDVARLAKDPSAGLRVAAVDFGGWDMHQNMGRSDGGAMAGRLGEMAAALAAFAADLGPDLDRVTLVTLSEFGRRVKENGDAGTDHGFGNCVLVLGGGVRGGRVYGRWPGLAPASLVDGDLASTTDYRAVIAEILTARCGVSDVGSVFPGLPGDRLGIVDPR